MPCDNVGPTNESLGIMSNRITPLILAVALFMEMMDSTVIATSLPAIAADIGSEPISLKLALAAYLVALAIFIPISGWMADRYGARNVFRGAIVVFMLGSVACAFADSLFTFVMARFLQGIGGSMMTPLARLILIRNTPKKDLINAWAWLTMPALFGPLAGPPVGGFLTTYFSWQWIFYINIPIGIIGIVLASKYLGGTGQRESRKLDWIGFLLCGTCFSGLIFGLSVVSLPALPPIFGISVAVAGFICGLLYIVHARRVENPVLDLKVFDERIFRTTTIAGLAFRISIGGMPFLFPLMLQINQLFMSAGAWGLRTRINRFPAGILMMFQLLVNIKAGLSPVTLSLIAVLTFSTLAFWLMLG